MKSHKGEIEIDKDEFIRDKEKGLLLFSYPKYKWIFTYSDNDDNSEVLKNICVHTHMWYIGKKSSLCNT